jgi:hypothetical protein
MALDNQQFQFANAANIAPGLDRATAAAGKSFDDMINNLIYEAADKYIGQPINAVKELGKGSVMELSSNKLDASAHSAPNLTPTSTPDISQKGNSTEVAKSMVPEKVIAQAQSIGNAGGLAVEHVAEANMGTFAPAYTPSMGAGRSQQGPSLA